MTSTVSSQQIRLSIERPALYVIATPIGNLADISYRAVASLRELDLLLVEDSRVTSRLLQHYSINVRQVALHEHNEARIVESVLADILGAGLAVGLVSDAGTPLVADPGYRLVRSAHEKNIPVYTIPGPNAAIAALSIAGLPSDRFAFEGFLPSKTIGRRRYLADLVFESRTLIFYEAPHRILATIEDLRAVFGGDREVAVGRELTKIHETLYRGPLRDVASAMLADVNAARGELVIVVTGATGADASVVERQALTIIETLALHIPKAEAIKLAADVTKVKRNRLYRLSHEIEKFEVKDE